MQHMAHYSIVIKNIAAANCQSASNVFESSLAESPDLPEPTRPLDSTFYFQLFRQSRLYIITTHRHLAKYIFRLYDGIKCVKTNKNGVIAKNWQRKIAFPKYICNSKMHCVSISLPVSQIWTVSVQKKFNNKKNFKKLKKNAAARTWNYEIWQNKKSMTHTRP